MPGPEGRDAWLRACDDWKKEVDLPNAPNLNPLLNDFPPANLMCPALSERRTWSMRHLELRQDLRALAEFLFSECEDLVSEGAYLDASNALKRVWDRALGVWD